MRPATRSVVRAYATAEKGGLKGARILLHPTVAEHDVALPFVLPGIFYNSIPIGKDETLNPLKILHELNYLGCHDRKLYRGVQRAEVSAPLEARGHYAATYRAMNRMRAMLGRPPIRTAPASRREQ